MKQILCLSTHAWSNIPSRTQQLMARMKGVRVLFLEPASGPLDRSWRQPGRRVRPELTVYTLPPLPTLEERYRPMFRMGQRRAARFLNDLLDRHRFRDFLLWTTSPVHVHLLDALAYDGLVYDCDREWDDLPDLWEGSLARAADVVFAASPDLAERLSPCSANIALLPNGVNYPLFSGGASSCAGHLLPQVSGPVFGWAGTVYRDLDLSPVLHAASAHPEWTFLLLGKLEDNPLLPRLRRLPNVVLPGPCPLSEVPDWLSRCQVCFNLVRESSPYSDIIPGRIYEYLSTGKPVVSMLWPDQVELFPDVIYGACSPQEFTRLCGQALEEDRSWVAQRRRSYGQAASWSARSADVLQILSTAGLL